MVVEREYSVDQLERLGSWQRCGRGHRTKLTGPERWHSLFSSALTTRRGVKADEKGQIR